jgi:hypothetical protein
MQRDSINEVDLIAPLREPARIGSWPSTNIKDHRRWWGKIAREEFLGADQL